MPNHARSDSSGVAAALIGIDRRNYLHGPRNRKARRSLFGTGS